MKTIGIIGGMSWESTLSYYRLINQKVNAKLGGLHSAKIIINSVDFADIEPLQRHGDWHQAGERLMAAAKALESAGADGFLIATNTMHKVAPQVEAEVNIPLIHIVDSTAHALQQKNVKTVGLLGTSFTMEQTFYRERLEHYGINVLTPDSDARHQIHDIIFNELCHGVINAHSRRCYINAIDALAENGAQAVILGCTEIGLLISQSDTQLPLFDTTTIHTDAAVEWMFKDTK